MNEIRLKKYLITSQETHLRFFCLTLDLIYFEGSRDRILRECLALFLPILPSLSDQNFGQPNKKQYKIFSPLIIFNLNV